MFFMISGRDPMPSENMYKNWDLSVNESSQSIKDGKWHSVAKRFSRLIINSVLIKLCLPCGIGF